MNKPSRKPRHVCPSCGRHIPQHQSDLAEELGNCPYCGKPLRRGKMYDPDAQNIVSRDDIDEEVPPGAR